jgi:hypothetical protein
MSHFGREGQYDEIYILSLSRWGGYNAYPLDFNSAKGKYLVYRILVLALPRIYDNVLLLLQLIEMFMFF